MTHLSLLLFLVTLGFAPAGAAESRFRPLRGFDLRSVFPDLKPGEIRQSLLRGGNLYFLLQTNAGWSLGSVTTDGRQPRLVPLGLHHVFWLDVDPGGKRALVLAFVDGAPGRIEVDLASGEHLRKETMDRRGPLPMASFFVAPDRVASLSRAGLVWWGDTGRPALPLLEDRGVLLADARNGALLAVEPVAGQLHVVTADGTRTRQPVSPNLQKAIERSRAENDRRMELHRGGVHSVALACLAGTRIVTLLTGQPVAQGYPLDLLDTEGQWLGSGNVPFPVRDGTTPAVSAYPAQMQCEGETLVVVGGTQVGLYAISNDLGAARAP
jgi:hypothetical protein